MVTKNKEWEDDAFPLFLIGFYTSGEVYLNLCALKKTFFLRKILKYELKDLIIEVENKGSYTLCIRKKNHAVKLKTKIYAQFSTND